MNLFVMANAQVFTFHHHIHHSEVHYMHTDTHKHSHLYCSPFNSTILSFSGSLEEEFMIKCKSGNIK